MYNMNKVNSKVILCMHCEGKGYKIYEELVNYHKGEYETSKYDCTICEGSGRLEEETRVKYTPYK